MSGLKRILFPLVYLTVILVLASCMGKEKSRTTGWDYNDAQNGGFEVSPYREQATGPGLIFIQGGTFTMGGTTDDVMYEWNNPARKVTVRSFYMDETEVSNVDYLEYLYWLNRVYGKTYPHVYRNALPDTLVWREKLAFNEPLIDNYLRHPAYHNYPVVGVSWKQASDYCVWRTDRVNEMLLIKQGILDYDPDQQNENTFNTEAYLIGQYQGLVKKPLRDLNPTSSGERQVRKEDGILLPKYRLPTEAEWEYAALGLIGNTENENVVSRRTYPWDGSYMRNNSKKGYGDFMDNIKRGTGDYMGVAGNLNDGADVPAPVGSYYPNDFGLYNMAGNVAEWVLDVYRQLSFEDVADYNPFRGNVFQVPERDPQGNLMPKDSLGRMRMVNVNDKDIARRQNYRTADNINYLDGDPTSLINFTDRIPQPAGTEDTTQISRDMNIAVDMQYANFTSEMYPRSFSLVSDSVRVYKGSSWKDNVYWASPGTRRFLNENLSTNYIGFRCAMDRVGSHVPAKPSKK